MARHQDSTFHRNESLNVGKKWPLSNWLVSWTSVSQGASCANYVVGSKLGMSVGFLLARSDKNRNPVWLRLTICYGQLNCRS